MNSKCLRLIVAGKSNKEIAAELDLSANTVASFDRANIMDALGIHKTADLVVYAIRSGLVTLGLNRRSFLVGLAGTASASVLPLELFAGSPSETSSPGFRLVDVTSSSGH